MSKKPSVWKPFLRFYTRFSIPWWMFVLAFLLGIAHTEVSLLVTEYVIGFNTGKLYNNVILGYMLLTLLQCLISLARNMFSTYGTQKATLRARRMVYSRILHLPTRDFEKNDPSSYVSRITADIPAAANLISYISLFVTSVYSLVRYYIIMLNFSQPLTLWLLLAVPLAILNFFVVGLMNYHAQKRIYTSVNTMTSFFSEHLSAIRHMKALTLEEEERQAGFDAIEKRFRADVFDALMSTLSVTSNSIYTNCCTLIMVFTGRNLINQGSLASTGLAAANSYLGNVQKTLAELLTHYQTLKGTQGVLGPVADIADTAEEELRTDSRLPMPENCRDIVLKDVTFSYDGQREILHGLSATIPAGKKTAIVGNNGCGKSTLFKLLMRFYEPTTGEILYGEENANTIQLDEWRTSFGYVLQAASLFSGTIRDNILYGCKREVTEDEIIAAAQAANAWEFIEEFPNGLDQNVGERGMLLSGGQRQRVAIARAILTNPSLMLMDEATASLDVQSDRLIWDAMKRVMQGRTTVLIAHDMNAVLLADHVIVMNRGSIEAEGTPDELFKTSPTFREYVLLQTSRHEGGAA